MERKEYLLKGYHDAKNETDARIREGIEKNRKGDLTVYVTDKDGRRLSAKIRVNQTGHAFRFGANCFMLDEMESVEKNENYKGKFAALFNMATLPFYWKDLEMEPGKPRYAVDSVRNYRRPPIDLCLNYCRAHGIEPKAHCLNYMPWTPEWVPTDTAEVKRLLEKRFAELGERYAGDIPNWEVINETLCPYNHRWDFFYDNDIIEWSFATARKYFKNNELTINEASMPWFERYRGNRIPYFMQVQRTLEHGTDIDSVGIQYHQFHRREQEEEIVKTMMAPWKLFDVMDTFATLGRPLQVTEVTIPAYTADSLDEELQAEAIRYLYSVWFSHEKMEKIIYWNLQDGYAAFAPQGDMEAGENYFRGGLLRFDGSEKPAYKCLRDLTQKEWHTEETGVTGADGFTFRGFFGTYEAEIEADGKKTKIPFSLEKGTEEITLTV